MTFDPPDPEAGEVTGRAVVPPTDAAVEAEAEARRAAARRRLLAEVFGDVLPDSTSDDRETDDGSAARDAEMLRDVPPHHG